MGPSSWWVMRSYFSPVTDRTVIERVSATPPASQISTACSDDSGNGSRDRALHHANLALLAGAAVLVAAIFFIGKAAGIIGGDSSADTSQTGQNTDASTDEEGMVVVPDLVGKTEEEAAALLEKENAEKLIEDIDAIEKSIAGKFPQFTTIYIEPANTIEAI